MMEKTERALQAMLDFHSIPSGEFDAKYPEFKNKWPSIAKNAMQDALRDAMEEECHGQRLKVIVIGGEDCQAGAVYDE